MTQQNDEDNDDGMYGVISTLDRENRRLKAENLGLRTRLADMEARYGKLSEKVDRQSAKIYQVQKIYAEANAAAQELRSETRQIHETLAQAIHESIDYLDRELKETLNAMVVVKVGQDAGKRS